MLIHQENLVVQTAGRETINITGKIAAFIAKAGVSRGICNVFLAHTSASLIFCENYDPLVQKDLEAYFSKLVPDGAPMFQHVAEGPDDMSAHIRTILTQNSLVVPIAEGKLVLGTWQGIFLWEHRLSPHERKLTITVLGQ